MDGRLEFRRILSKHPIHGIVAGLLPCEPLVLKLVRLPLDSFDVLIRQSDAFGESAAVRSARRLTSHIAHDDRLCAASLRTMICIPGTHGADMKFPALNPDDFPWTVSAKYGRWLMCDMDDRRRREIAADMVTMLAGETVRPWIAPADDPRAGILTECAKDNPYLFVHGCGDVVALSYRGFAKRCVGGYEWHYRNHDETFRMFAASLPTVLGAFAIVRNAETVRRIASQSTSGYPYLGEDGFYVKAYRTLGMAESADANRRYAARHTAGEFEDKIHCDTAHRNAAASSRLATRFEHVELDDSVDLAWFKTFDTEFDRLYSNGLLPQVSDVSAFRLRKCGRRHAIGLYSPSHKAIAVDPRAPHSTLHELAHAYDYAHGQLSTRPEFRPILDEYRKGLARLDVSPSRRDYGLTPTETFARAWELNALWHGHSSMFAAPNAGALLGADPLCRPLEPLRDMVEEYFKQSAFDGFCGAA